MADAHQQLIDNKAALTNPRWDASFDNSIQSGQLDRHRGRRLGSPTVHRFRWRHWCWWSGRSPSSVTGLWQWLSKTGADGGSGVARSRVPSTRPKPWSSLTGSTPRLMTLSPRAFVVGATTAGMPRPRRSGPDYFSGQGCQCIEFKTANDNIRDFTYMPALSPQSALQ